MTAARGVRAFDLEAVAHTSFMLLPALIEAAVPLGGCYG